MDVAIVLEEKEDDYLQIEDLLHSFNSGLVVHRFKAVEEFALWFGKLVNEPPEDEYVITCLVSNSRIMGAKHLKLFEKISKYMKQNGFLAEGKERLPILIVARDVEGFDRHEYQHEQFDNILFKPIDQAIWHGKIDWALSGVDAMGNEELQKQKPVSPLEMLKDVKIDRITELGFRSMSSKPIDTGRVAKYYIPSLKPLGADYGIYASCTESKQMSGSNDYACSFSFFGLDVEKAKNIRRLIRSAPEQFQLNLENTGHAGKLGVVVISEESDLLSRLESSVQASFRQTDIRKFENFMDFFSEIDADKAIEAWLNSFSNTSPVTLEYDLGSQVFMRAFQKGNSKKPVDQFLDLDAEQIKKFKMLCLGSCLSSQRTRISQYWSKPGMGNHLVAIRDKKKTSFVTIEGSEVVEVKGESKKLHVHVRPSTAPEVKEYKRTESLIPDQLSLLLISGRIAQTRNKDFWIDLKKRLGGKRELPIIVVGKSKLQLFDQATENECFSDYLVDPFDQVYLKKKIKYLIPEMTTEESSPSRDCARIDEVIKVGVQVDIRNFSEISLSVDYSRMLEKNSFREFVIYIHKDRSYEELLAKQVAGEEDQADPNIKINHFTIFGHGDKTNQRIRQWLNEQYALSVQDDGEE